jgi:hypothetical protein
VLKNKEELRTVVVNLTKHLLCKCLNLGELETVIVAGVKFLLAAIQAGLVVRALALNNRAAAAGR